LEEAAVVAYLGVPQHGQGEPPARVLDGLDGAVVGVTADGQVARVLDALVVRGADHDAVPEHVMQSCARGVGDPLLSVRARCGTVLFVTDQVRQVLVQVAA
jgi:hypothetical protein